MSDAAPGDAPREKGIDAGLPVRIFTPPVRAYLLARFSSAMAFQIQGVAIGWYIYDLTGSALQLGFVGLAMFVPQAALALHAGQMIDRLPRRKVLMAAWALQALAMSGIALLALFSVGRTEFVFLLIGCFGAGRSFDQPAQAAILPTLVPVPLFPRVTPANSLVNQAAVVIGPALGGLLFLLGAPAAFFGGAVMMTVAIAAIATLPRVPPRPAEPPSWARLLGGISFLRGAEAVRGAITMDMFGVLFGGGATMLLPIFARDIFAIGPLGLGFLRSAPAIGALAMGLYLARRPLERGVGRAMFAALACYGAATVAFGLSQVLALSFAVLIFLGAADVVSVVVRSTLVQTATPDALRGRVSAVNSLFVGTSNQLGAFEAGLTAYWFGATGAVVLGGAITLIVVVIASQRFPALRRMDRFIMAQEHRQPTEATS